MQPKIAELEGRVAERQVKIDKHEKESDAVADEVNYQVMIFDSHRNI